MSREPLLEGLDVSEYGDDLDDDDDRPVPAHVPPADDVDDDQEESE